VQEVYHSIIIDTLDVAGAMCDKYICNQLGIDNIGDGGWTNNGWARYKKELEDSFRAITQLGYALIFISHDKDKTFKRQDGSEYNQIVPTAQTSLNNIAKDMADLYIYAKISKDGKRTLVFRSLDNSIDCGCRFKYIVPEIELNYDALIKALNDAIDKEAQEHDNKFITDERASVAETPTYDYSALMSEFQEIVGSLMNKNSEYYGPRIVQIVEKYLGKGKKISETTIEQAEFVYLIVTEIKEELIKTDK